MKKIIAAALAMALSLSSVGFMAMADDDVKIEINGSELVIPEGDTKPFIENDRTLVPMRVIFEALNATVEWDDATKTVTSYDVLSDVKLVLTVDSNIMLKNGEKVELDVPAKIVGDRTVVPLRAVAEGMSADVEWDGETRTVKISKGDDGKDYVETNEYKTLDEVNAAIKANGKNVFEVKAIDDPVVVNGYKYDPESNTVEIDGEWAVGAGSPLTITIQKPARDGELDPNAEFVEEFDTIDGEFGVMYQMKDNKYSKYALVVHNGYDFKIAIEGRDKDGESEAFDPADVIKDLAKTVIVGYEYTDEETKPEDNFYDFKTLEELNAAIKLDNENAFEVKELEEPVVVEGYQYNADTNTVKIIGEWAVGAGSPLTITIQKPAQESPEDPDAEFVEEFDTIDGEYGVMYQMKDNNYSKYALVVHNGYGFEIAIEGRDKIGESDAFDPSDVIKDLAKTVISAYSETK